MAKSIGNVQLTDGGVMKPQIVNLKMNRMLLRGRIVKLGIFAAALAMMVTLTGLLYFKNTVYVTDNGITREIKTNETDIYAILRSEDYELGINDRISCTKDENNSEHIIIHRAFDITVTADGETNTFPATDGTVVEALENIGITLGEDDRLNCRREDKVTAGMEIIVTRIKYVTKTEESEIPYDTEYIDNSNRKIGDETVITEGENGKHTVTVKETYIDGKLSDTKQLSETISKQPVTQVVERGTAINVPYAKMEDPTKLKLVNGIPEQYTRVISGKSTAYSARAGARTASGRYAVVGTVAVNPNVIPYGSELYIVSPDGTVYGYAIAADTGLGLMDGRTTIDLFMGSYADSCRWGVHYVDIYVLSEGNG